MQQPINHRPGFIRNEPAKPHYYGDLVRKLFIVAAAIMLVTLPVFQDLIFTPSFISTSAILLIAIIAGLTSPRRKEVAIFDVLSSLFGTVVYEYRAIQSFNLEGETAFFLTNQALALIFLIALYFATKTLRGMFPKL